MRGEERNVGLVTLMRGKERNVGLVTLVSERKGDECWFGNTSE